MSATTPDLDFFLIGAPKAGTSSLYSALKQHPQLYLPKLKEPRFFSKPDFANHWRWYYSLFKNQQNQIVGEASVNYCETHIWPEIPSRIARFYPQAKLIYLLRHPLKRIESFWIQALNSGHWYKHYDYLPAKMPREFNQAVLKYPHFIGTSLYWQRLSDFRQFFSTKQILLIFFEDLITNPALELKKVYHFLGVDSTVSSALKLEHKNQRQVKKMDPGWLAAVKSLLFQSKLHQLLPRNRVTKGWLTALKTNFSQEINWRPEVKAEVIAAVQKDSRQILEFAGKDENFWQFRK